MSTPEKHPDRAFLEPFVRRGQRELKEFAAVCARKRKELYELVYRDCQKSLDDIKKEEANKCETR